METNFISQNSTTDLYFAGQVLENVKIASKACEL